MKNYKFSLLNLGALPLFFRILNGKDRRFNTKDDLIQKNSIFYVNNTFNSKVQTSIRQKILSLYTCKFGHLNYKHLIINLLSISIIFPYFEGKYGTRKLLLCDTVSQIFGSFFGAFFCRPSIGIGASCGIYGVLGSLARKNEKNNIFVLVLLYLCSTTIFNFRNCDNKISHLSGFMSGYFL